jgi:hypothetical protein
MRDYVATVQIEERHRRKPHLLALESTFGAPRGREREFADLVGRGVYEAGFAGLRAYLGL